MKLSIIIVGYNTRDLAADCIRSIYENTSLRDISYEIILVDNASTDDSCDHIRSLYPDVKIIENATNLGFGRANNIGADAATGEWLLLLNSDTTVTDTDFATVLEAADGLSDTGAFSVKLLNTDGSPQCVGYDFPSIKRELKVNLLLSEFNFRKRRRLARRADRGLHECDWVSGAFMLIRRDRFIQVGGFDDHIFMYSEDIDLCARLHAAGYTSYMLDTTAIVHHVRGSAQNVDAPAGNRRGRTPGRPAAPRKPVTFKTLLGMKRNYYYVIRKNKLMRPLWFARVLGTINIFLLWIYKKITS